MIIQSLSETNNIYRGLVEIIKEILICNTHYESYPNIEKGINKITSKYGITVDGLEAKKRFPKVFEINNNGNLTYFYPLNEIGKKI